MKEANTQPLWHRSVTIVGPSISEKESFPSSEKFIDPNSAKKTVQYFIAVLRVLQLSFKFVISHDLFLISKRTWNKHVSHWLFKLEYILRRKHYSIDLSLVAHPRATATEYYVLTFCFNYVCILGTELLTTVADKYIKIYILKSSFSSFSKALYKLKWKHEMGAP